MELRDLIDLIRKKKELSDISDSLVLESLNKYLTKHKINPSNLRPSETKLIVKEIRAQLRNFVGQFQLSPKKKEKFLETEDFSSLLETHSSTKERLSFYPELKSLLSELKVKSILDLGCGINPVALATKEITYYASDINESDLAVVSAFFKKNDIEGKVFAHNLREDNSSLPKADLCIMFKILDTIETKGHKIAESLILTLKDKCKYILISFSTRKLSGKSMNFPERKWLEHLLTRLSIHYEIFKSDSEIFYLIK
jgi:ribosomal protein RSM22 (predicted rRNA methylase)